MLSAYSIIMILIILLGILSHVLPKAKFAPISYADEYSDEFDELEDLDTEGYYTIVEGDEDFEEYDESESSIILYADPDDYGEDYTTLPAGERVDKESN